MGRIWKIVSVTVVLVVALAVGGIAVLKSTDFNSYRGLIAKRVEAFTGRKLTISGNLKLRISLNPALTVEGVTLANAAWGTRSEMIKMKRLEAEVELLPLLSGKVFVKRIVLVGLDALLETDAKGRKNWIFGKPEGAGKAETGQKQAASGLVPVVRMVRVKDATITYLDGVSGRRTVATVKRLDFTADGLNGPLKLDLSGAYNNVSFAASSRLGSLNELLGGSAPFPVSAKVKALGVSVDINGTINNPRQMSGLNLKVAVDLPDISPLAVGLGIVISALPPLSAAVHLADVPGGYVLDPFKAVIGNSDVAGRIAISLDRKRPKADLRLTSNRIDIDQLLTKEKGTGKVAKKGRRRVFSADPLAIGWLKAADARIDFKGKRIDVGGMTISDASIKLKLKDGRLDLSPLKATLYKGKINADILLDGTENIPKTALKLDLRQLDYGALLSHFNAGNIVSGKVDVSANVKGRGKSVRAIMASLGGRLRGSVIGGKVESGMLNILSADVLSALPFVDSKGDKDIRCAVIDFAIRSGVAKSRAIIFETGGLSMVGKGSINLADETLDLKIDPSAKKLSLMKLAMLPVDVGGTLASPSVTPDIGAAAVGLVSGAVSTGTSIVADAVKMIGSATGGGHKTGGVDKTDYCKLALAGKPLVRLSAPVNPPPVRRKNKNIIENIGSGIGGAVKSLFGK